MQAATMELLHGVHARQMIVTRQDGSGEGDLAATYNPVMGLRAKITPMRPMKPRWVEFDH